MVFVLTVCASVVSVWAATAVPSVPKGVCLRQNMIEGWKVLNDKSLIVIDRAGKKFRLSLTGACHDLQFQTVLAFRPFSGSGISCLTRNDTVIASLPGYGGPPERCLITEIGEYTSAMENADQVAEGTLYHHPDTHGEIGAIP
jgi:Family of unknown function (DUF6491)